MPTARGEWVRYALLAVALTMVVLAIPALLTPLDGGESHLARESGGWSAALGVALLVVAWQPRRARGLLPLAAALAGVMVVAAAVDVVAGDAALAGESTHLLELAALGLLWLEARLAPRSDGHALRAN
jgi:predicted anti-sigma-YlaC factor YlaD